MKPLLNARTNGLGPLRSVALGILLLVAPAAPAALRTWTGAGVNALWSTPANWTPAGAPQSGEDLAFPAAAPHRTSTNDLTGRTFGFILFNGANSDYELFGNGIILSGGLSSVSTAPLTKSPNLNLDITLAQDLRFVADDGGLGATRGVVLAGHTLTLNTTTSNALVALEGVISGVGDVVKVGVGQALFGGPNGNTYQGTLSVTEGIMLLGKGNGGNGLAVPGNLVIGSPIDPFGFMDPFVFGEVVMVNENMIASSGKITINHGSINQNGFDQVIGPLELYDGGIDTSNAMLTVTATISQPHWFFTRYPFINGHLSLPFDTTFDLHQPGHLYIGATISGAGGITQQGSGSMELFNTNDFTGAVTVNGGLLWVAESTQALGQNAVVTLNQDGILGLDTVTIANKTLVVTSPGAALLAIDEPCVWTGPIHLNFTGQAQVTAGFVFGLDSSTSLRLTGPIHGTGGLRLGGHSIELTGNNDFTGDVSSAGELLLLNTGALRPFTGALTVGGSFRSWGFSYGELDRAYTNALCEVRWLDSAFQLVPKATIRTNGWANLNGHDNEFGSLDMTGGRISSGAGKLFLDGPVTNHAAGVTASIEGALQLATFPAVTFDVAAGAAGPDLRISAVISDGIPSGIDKEGDGELLLTAANTYRNATTVGGGVLQIRNDNALGTTGAGTTVLDGATLDNETAVALAEPLTLNGPGRGGTNGALFLGPATGVQAGLVLASDATVRNDAQFAILSGVISGPGGLTKTGAGTLQLGGGSGANNTYGGDTVVTAGVLVPDKGAGITTIPGHLIIGGGSGIVAPTATVRHFSGFTIGGSVTVNRGGLWDLNGQSESFSLPALQGRPPLTLNGGGDVQTGVGLVLLPIGGDVVVNPGTGLGGSSFISGNLGLDPGQHRFVVGRGITIIGLDIPDLDLSAVVTQSSTGADLVKEGPGEMRVSGNSSFTGSVTVNDGLLIVAHAHALGTAAGGAFVNQNGAMALDGGIEVTELLTLDSTNAAALISLGPVTNTWSGDIVLQRTATIHVPDSNGGFTHLGGVSQFDTSSISGPGGFTKSGRGSMYITGLFGGNSYAGLTTISDGLLHATRRSRSLSDRIVVTGANSVLRTGRSAGLSSVFTVLPAGANVTVQAGALWAMSPTNSETLSRLLGDGRLDTGSGGTLTLSNSVSCEFSGVVSGSGALKKFGLASLHVTGVSPAYTGPVTIFDGTYKVDGQVPNSPVTVKTSSILRGGGVVGDVTVENDGVVQIDPLTPGVRSGVFQMNSANFQIGSVLGAAFYGPDPTGGNDSLLVNNAVTLTGAKLSIGFEYPPHEGDVVTLLKKLTAGAVTGNFSGSAEGTVRAIGGIPVVFSYVGGDGNDVTLTVTNLPLQGGGSQMVSGDGGHAFVPNDCAQLWLVVTNRGATTVTGLHGFVRSLTPDVVVTMAEAAFPDLAPNGRGSNATPFQIRTEPGFVCGGGVQLELVLTASNLPPTAILYTFSGPSGYALNFDGRNDEVEVAPNSFSAVVNNFTMELWANPTANRTVTAETNAGISGVNVALRQLQRFAVFPDRGNFAYGPTHVSAGLSIGRNGISVYEQGTNYLPSRLVYSNALSGWTHVALVYASRRPQLYVNGTLVRSGLAGPFSSVHPSGSLGGSAQADYGNFAGQLDEVRIWNVALSQAQIQSNMTSSLTGTEPNLVTYFRCDEGGGNALTDSAPASPNPTGTLTDGASFVFPGVVPFSIPGVSCDSGRGACESCLVVSGTFTTNTPMLGERLYVGGGPSVCFPAKPCPGPDHDTNLPPSRFITHTFANNGSSEACVTAQMRFDCPGVPGQALHVAAYLGDFDPGDACRNYLGDSLDATQPFSFQVPAGSNVVLVVSTLFGDPDCSTYALQLFGLPCPPPRLEIARDHAPNKVLLQWSSAYPDFRLQAVSNLEGPGPLPFGAVSNPPALLNGKYTVTNATTAPREFFRLEAP